MNRNTTVTLDQVHTAIVAAITAKFPALKTVKAYTEARKGVQLPACLVEMTEMEPAPDVDPGTGQLSVMASFSAQLIIGFRQGELNPKLEIRKLAAAFAAFARLQRWGCKIGPAEVIGAYPDDFNPELDQFEVWRVDWQQVLHLGETVWTDSGATPTQVFIGQPPLIGEAYQDDYKQVNE